MLRISLITNQLMASSNESSDDLVLYDYQQKVCKATLNKPKALNSLDLQMVRNLQQEVNKWKENSDLKVVIFKGNGDKAFCAGGDIKSLYDAKQNGTHLELGGSLFREEYKLDYEIATIKQIQVVLWDGIVMGGGVGISINAPIRIATENCIFAMPEAKIGLFTDVGAGYFLSRLRGNLGYFLGLTGTRVKGVELVQIGLADFYVKREKLQELEKDIVENTNSQTTIEDIKTTVRKYEEKVEGKYKDEDFINKVFGKCCVDEIYKALKEEKEHKELADKLLGMMDSQSSLSMKIIFELLTRGKNLDLKENLKMDLRIVLRILQGNEFFEGIRCALVHKNDKPNWDYKSLDQVPKEVVEKYFEKLPENLELF